jgi:hypothetical protein
MIRIAPATRPALDYIERNLRDIDRRELAATSFSDTQFRLADRVMAAAVMAFVASDQQPISAWGLVDLWPGVGSAFAFGTDEWGRALWPMTRHVRRFMMPLLLEHGYHRVECRALSDREDVGRFVALFDATQEAVMRSSGKRGEDFIIYRWLSNERRPAATKRAGCTPIALGERLRRRAARRAVRDVLC